jgi:Protein involved in formate dehydrogenase formation
LILVLAAERHRHLGRSVRPTFHDRAETYLSRRPRRSNGRRDRAVDHPWLRGDLGQGYGTGNDPRLGNRRLGMEAPPQVAARGGRQRAEMSTAGRIAKPIDIGRVANPPPVLPPDRSQVFRRRARRRFDRVAAGSTIADFLSFMAAIAAVQSAALASLPASVAPETPLSYCTPPFDRRNWRSDGSWRDTLTMICNRAGCAVADRPNSCRARTPRQT